MEFARKNDKLISVGVFLLILLLVFFVSRDFFLTFAHYYPLPGGFVKFFLLASMGDFVGLRLKSGVWQIPKHMFLKALIWGFIGILIVMMFTIFPTGVKALQRDNILPFAESGVLTALLISTFMNVIFAPTMMSFHRMTDTMLEYDLKPMAAIEKVDWTSFYKIVIFRTIPFFWIPAHTITFLIPEEYRIILAAVLGIFLGLLLSIFKK